MDKETKLLEALVENCRWSDQVATLFGFDWDNDGRQLIDLVWSDFNDRYGEVGMELIGEFIACGSTSLYDENDKIINVMTIPELMEVLTKYCKGEK